jgi:hypothetical protein
VDGRRPTLGYDIQDRTLVIDEEDSRTVGHIFETYVQFGAVHRVQKQLDAERITSERPPA